MIKPNFVLRLFLGVCFTLLFSVHSLPVKQISTGGEHSCALLDTNKLKCWGRNVEGQTGVRALGSIGDARKEMGEFLATVDLGTDRTVLQVSTGYRHTCAVLDTNDIKCWGRNDNGELGYGDTIPRGQGLADMGDNLAPVFLGSGRTALQVSAGETHTCAILDTNQVKCSGEGLGGKLGHGDENNRGDLSPAQMGDALPVVLLPSGRSALQITTGAFHTCVLLDNNAVSCWGFGSLGRLGSGNTQPRGDVPNQMGNQLPEVSLGTGRTAVQVAAGRDHTCVILDTDEVKCWGNGNFGALGDASTSVRGDGPGEMGEFLPVVNLGTGRTATSVSVGLLHSCAVLDNNETKCWGFGGGGALGYEDAANRGDGPNEMGDFLPDVNVGAGRTAVQVGVGYEHACALLDSKDVKCWGVNGNGQLGYGDTNGRGAASNTMGDNLDTVDLGLPEIVSQIAAGSFHTCVLLTSDDIKCWGSGAGGRLGYGDTTTRGTGSNQMGDNLDIVDLGTGRKAVDVDVGDDHTCAILDDSTVKCWGASDVGQLGYGDTDNRGNDVHQMGDNLTAVDLGDGLTALRLACGAFHTCVVLTNGQVKCWGANLSGQLGYGDKLVRGNEEGDMGNALPAVDLGSGITAIDIAAGDSHTCALLSSNEVKCWGFGGVGQLGYENPDTLGDEPREMGDKLTVVDLGDGLTVTQIVVARSHTCALLNNNAVKCWGFGMNGRLGYGNPDNRGDASNQMGNDLPNVPFGAVSVAQSLAAGDEHTCAVLLGAVKCWGKGLSGVLGSGGTDDIGDQGGELGASPGPSLGTGRFAVQMSVSAFHSCAILNTNEVKCWGFGAFGALGYGDTRTRGDGPNEMGDALPAVDITLPPEASSPSPSGAEPFPLLEVGIAAGVAGLVIAGVVAWAVL